MSKVFVNIGLSLDGYMAPEGMTMENPEYKNWGTKWGALMAWLLNQQYMRENLKFGPGGETGPVNDLVRSTFERIGANIMGKRMFDQGEVSWPEEAPFHTPVPSNHWSPIQNDSKKWNAFAGQITRRWATPSATRRAKHAADVSWGTAKANMPPSPRRKTDRHPASVGCLRPPALERACMSASAKNF